MPLLPMPLLPNPNLRSKLFFAGIAGVVVLIGIGALWWWIIANAGSALPLLSDPPEDLGELVTNGASPFKLPPGFSVNIYASNLHGPRVMTRDPRGVMLVSLPEPGKIIALPDENKDGVADRIVDVLGGLNKPHGIIFHDNMLYIAETDRVGMYAYDPATYTVGPKRTIIELPSDGYNQHFTRTLHVANTPDGERLLTSIGSSCNVCNEEERFRATIISSNFDGSDTIVYARGLRNSVFMDTHPLTGDLWATEMGRDLLGDEIPPDEINIIKKDGHYGWPTCYGKNIHDTDFDTNTYIRAPCTEPYEKGSMVDLPAHSAPLGLAFIPEEGWPESLRHDLIVAYHGSWNRSTPTGYKLVRVKLDEDRNPEGIEDFMTGFLRDDGEVLGRPVDVMAEPGGVMFVTDDRAGIVYRISAPQ